MGIVEFLSVHSYRVITLGTFLVGTVCGVLGVYLYLRRQAILSDVIGHASTMGVMAGFMFASLFLPVDGRSLAVIVPASLLACLVAVLLSDWVASTTPLKHDTTMAIMLALFYGGGIVIIRIITNSNLFTDKGGITRSLLGSATSLTSFDLHTIVVLGILCIVTVILLRKEFALFCFDPTYAAVSGFHSRLLSPLLLIPTVVAVVLGVKAVGIVLMVAFAVIPPACARQWTNHVSSMVVVSGTIGGFGAAIGAWISVSLGKVPTGPVIVIVLTACLLFSLLFSPNRSIIWQAVKRNRKRRELNHLVNSRTVAKSLKDEQVKQ